MLKPFSSIAAPLLGTLLLVVLVCVREERSDPAPVAFNTPEEAVATLITILQHADERGLERLLGAGTEPLASSGDTVADRITRQSFLMRYRTRHRLVAGGPDDLVLHVGKDDWPLPVPLVRADQRWHFDRAARAGCCTPNGRFVQSSLRGDR